MSVEIQGVPESITFEAVRDLLALIGIDASCCQSVHIGIGGIEAQVLAKNEDGRFYVLDGNAATHRISIPVVSQP